MLRLFFSLFCFRCHAGILFSIGKGLLVWKWLGGWLFYSVDRTPCNLNQRIITNAMHSCLGMSICIVYLFKVFLYRTLQLCTRPTRDTLYGDGTI